MNPNLCRVALRPRGPLEVFDLGVRLLAASPRAFAWLLALVVTPPWLVASAVAVALPDAGPWLLAAAFVVGPFVQLPFTLLGGKLLFAESVSAREVLRDLWSLAVPAVQVATAQVALALFGLFACGVGWFVFVVPTLYLAEAALLERVDFGRQIRRSSRLSSAQGFSALVGAAAVWFGTAWFVLVAEGAGSALLGTVLQLGSPFGSLYTGTVTPWALLGTLAAHPFLAVYRMLLYIDSRTRVEGWDLQVRLRAAGLA